MEGSGAGSGSGSGSPTAYNKKEYANLDRPVLLLLHLYLDGLERLDVQDVVRVVQRRLLVVEGREAHALEVTAITLLSSHHDPHRSPLEH